jgi:hypothetical protein
MGAAAPVAPCPTSGSRRGGRRGGCELKLCVERVEDGLDRSEELVSGGGWSGEVCVCIHVPDDVELNDGLPYRKFGTELRGTERELEIYVYMRESGFWEVIHNEKKRDALLSVVDLPDSAWPRRRTLIALRLRSSSFLSSSMRSSISRETRRAARVMAMRSSACSGVSFGGGRRAREMGSESSSCMRRAIMVVMVVGGKGGKDEANGK